MDDEERTAFATLALEVSAAYGRFAAALGADVSVATSAAPPYGPATMKLSWQERVLRQCLILNDISTHGGSVPQTTWYEIARHYGYSGRGLAGFFRGDGQGLLDLRKGRVYITKRGKDRLSENIDRVQRALEAEET